MNLTAQEIELLFTGDPRRLEIASRLQMMALVRRGVSPSWESFIASDDWKAVVDQFTPAQVEKYELIWRRIQDDLRSCP